MGCNRSSDNSMQLSPFLRCGHVRSFSCHTPIILYYDTIVKYHRQKNFALLRGGLPSGALFTPLAPLSGASRQLSPRESQVHARGQRLNSGKANLKRPLLLSCTAEGAVFMPSQSRSARQLPRTHGSQNVTSRPGLPRVRGRWPAGPERATTNNAGASLSADPRRGTLSFVTQKFFCFGAINNRRNIG